MDYLKKSRIEEVLIAILGKGTVTSQLISRIEKILDAIRVNGSYDGIAMSEVEEILVCILLGKRFEKPTHSRIAAMLKVKANGGEYTELRKSRVEDLIFEWINAVKHATYTGTLPATLQTVDGYLESYKIYGNTVQDGTPTPESPIVPSGCGVRTENLFDFADAVPKKYIDANPTSYIPYGYKLPMMSRGNNLFDLYSYSNITANISNVIIDGNNITYNARAPYVAIVYKFNLGIADVYTISLGGNSFNTRLELRYMKNGSIVGRAIVIEPNQNATIRGSDAYDEFAIYISNSNNIGTCTASNIILNLGSTALPYEPYHRTVTNIYLGEVQTTRKIKKLVLTGKETLFWSKSSSRPYSWYLYPQQINALTGMKFFCTHGATVTQVSDYVYGTVYADDTYNFGIFPSLSTVAEVNSWLAQQYAAGTPVTVWYVLAKPETGIVNEPLMKIGDYADAIDSAQSTVQIPTAAGTTVIDYDGEPKPYNVELKYSKPK